MAKTKGFIGVGSRVAYSAKAIRDFMAPANDFGTVTRIDGFGGRAAATVRWDGGRLIRTGVSFLREISDDGRTASNG